MKSPGILFDKFIKRISGWSPLFHTAHISVVNSKSTPQMKEYFSNILGHRCWFWSKLLASPKLYSTVLALSPAINIVIDGLRILGWELLTPFRKIYIAASLIVKSWFRKILIIFHCYLLNIGEALSQ